MRFGGALSRLDSLSWITLGIVVLIGMRLFYLQVLRYPHYRALQSRQVVTQAVGAGAARPHPRPQRPAARLRHRRATTSRW